MTDASTHPAADFAPACLVAVDEQRIRELRERDEFFWLDVTGPSADDLAKLGDLFGFHPLALEDVAHGSQRPKMDEYRDHVFMVFYGADEHGKNEDEILQEVHLFISGQFVVTLHDDHLPVFEQQRAEFDGKRLRSEQFVLYRLFDTLTDTFFPVLARLDDEIDVIEEAVVECPTDEQLQRLFAIKRELVAMRKVVTPERDLFARAIDRIAELPGLQLDERDYFRDVYDHLIRISDLIDSYRDLLSSATDLYLSTVANRQNEVMKQLAIVGTIFLPLSFITGFFGMNFGWLVNHALTHTWTFWAVGVGSMVATCIGLLVLFKRRGWI